MNELIVFVFFYIEEAAAASFLGLRLLGLRPRFREILIIGILQGFVVYLFRSSAALFKLPAGMHMVFTLLALLIIIKYAVKVTWGLASATALMSFITIALSEAIVYTIASKYLHLNVDVAFRTAFGHILVAYLGDTLMFLGAVIVGITGFSLIKMEKYKDRGDSHGLQK